MGDAADWAQALEASAFAAFVRGGDAYPLANVLHLFGMALVVAPMLLLDLRLLGAGRAHFPLPATSAVLTRCALAGAALAVPSGAAMFSADAVSLAANPILLAKLALLALAAANALAFRLLWSNDVIRAGRPAPLFARAQLLLSMALWLSIPALGRWIAYA